MEEQFIQDAISKLPRLQRVIAQLGFDDWRSDESDLLNQEFNFAVVENSGQKLGGRMDVIATFNGRTRLVVVEVKLIACPADLEQLLWYVKNCHQLRSDRDAGLSSVDFKKTIGLLLAGNFVPGNYDTQGECIHCVKFEFNGSSFPFESPAKIDESNQTSAPSVIKRSRLVTVEDHVEHLEPPIRAAYDELALLCMSKDDPRQAWRIENPKSGHIAIHYKGIYVLYFFSRKKSFDFGYSGADGKVFHDTVRADGSGLQQVLEAARTRLAERLAAIDSDTSAGIPTNFSWTKFDGG